MAGKFKGFHGKLISRGVPCWVMNEGTAADGTPAYKVRLGCFGGYSGWSGGSYRVIHYTGKIIWTPKTNVKRGKASK